MAKLCRNVCGLAAFTNPPRNKCASSSRPTLRVRQSRAALVEKHGLFARELGPAERNPGTEPVHGHRTDRTQPLAAPLAANSNQFLFQIEVVEVQPDQLADPQPAAVERFEHGAIAHARRRIDRHRVEKSNHFVDAQAGAASVAAAWDYEDQPTGPSPPGPGVADTERTNEGWPGAARPCWRRNPVRSAMPNIDAVEPDRPRWVGSFTDGLTYIAAIQTKVVLVRPNGMGWTPVARSAGESEIE